MTKLVKSPVARLTRSGAQNAIHVQKRIVQMVDGRAHISVELNLADLPIPDRQYVADKAFVSLAPDGQAVRLGFGQSRLVGNDLRSLVVITLSPESVLSFLRTLATFEPDTAAFLDAQGIPVPELGVLSAEPEQTVAMAANIIAIARAGRDATTDFYLAPAAALHSLTNTEDKDAALGIEPVLRLEAPIALMYTAIRELLKLQEKLPKEIA